MLLHHPIAMNFASQPSALDPATIRQRHFALAFKDIHYRLSSICTAIGKLFV
jgi:hypothetical protein